MTRISKTPIAIGNPAFDGLWINNPTHHAVLRNDVQRQLDFFRPMLRSDGGLIYTLKYGKTSVADWYWSHVTKAIGALAALQIHVLNAENETHHRTLWAFADSHLIDHERGGWFPELDDDAHAAPRQFLGKPDIHHSIQAGLFSPVPALSPISTSQR